MDKLKRLWGLITSVEDFYGLLTTPLVSGIVLPALIAFVAFLMAWLQGLPWLEIYVVSIFVAACGAVLVRQLLDRWQATTDREKLVYLGMSFEFEVEPDSKSPKNMVATIQFQNNSHKRMTVELDRFDVRVENRVHEDAVRKVSKFTIGSGVDGHFGSNSVDLQGLDSDRIHAKVYCLVKYGFGPSLPRCLVSEMAGEGKKNDAGGYVFRFWDAEMAE